MEQARILTRADLGPRVYVKRDEESSIGRGCVLFGAHFRPEVARMVWALCRVIEANMYPAENVSIMLTEGHRDIRDTKDCHETCDALDVVVYFDGERRSRAVHTLLAAETGKLLGADYDVLAHGEGANLHIHMEYDPDA